MAKKPDWNHYFNSHYKPEEETWGKKDLQKYKVWYLNWINYIQQKNSFTFENMTGLELGCGIGSICSLLQEKKMTIIGSDIASEMVLSAKKVSPGIDFLVYDVMKKFPLKRSFDYIFAFEVLEHIPELNPALKNIHSLLKNNGWFVGTSPFPYSKNMIDKTHVNVHEPLFWKKKFEEHLFRNVHTFPMSFVPLLWRLPLHLNPVIPVYIPFPGFVSTTLIVAQK